MEKAMAGVRPIDAYVLTHYKKIYEYPWGYSGRNLYGALRMQNFYIVSSDWGELVNNPNTTKLLGMASADIKDIFPDMQGIEIRAKYFENVKDYRFISKHSVFLHFYVESSSGLSMMMSLLYPPFETGVKRILLTFNVNKKFRTLSLLSDC